MAACGTYNVSLRADAHGGQWVREIARVHGWPGEVVLAKSDLLPEALRRGRIRPSPGLRDRFKPHQAELGYGETVREDEALRRTIEWERRNPPEPGSMPGHVAQPDYEAEDRALAALRRDHNLHPSTHKGGRTWLKSRDVSSSMTSRV